MSGYPYLCLEDLFEWIDDENRPKCKRLWDDHKERFEQAYGSIHNHQAWPGGYKQHLEEIMNLAIILFEPLKETGRKINFLLGSAMLVLYLHDLEKPWKYEIGSDGQLQHTSDFPEKLKDRAFREAKIAEYEIRLSEQEYNALTYVEGEGKDYAGSQRVMNSLAAFCHMCDTLSARVFFDYPLKKHDPWKHN